MLTKRLLKTISYAVLEEDFRVGMDATGGARDLTLPDVGADRDYILDKDDASVNPVNVKAPAGGSINGASQVVLASQYDSVHVVCMGSKAYRIVSSSIANGNAAKGFDITMVGTIADGYVYDPGFTPRLVMLFHADGGNVMGYGWAVGIGATQQGCFFRDATSSLTKQSGGNIAIYASGHSVYRVTAFGSTVTITRTLVVEDLKNVVLIAFK